MIKLIGGILCLAGIAAVVAGVAFIYWPAAIIVAGAVLVGVGYELAEG